MNLIVRKVAFVVCVEVILLGSLLSFTVCAGYDKRVEEGMQRKSFNDDKDMSDVSFNDKKAGNGKKFESAYDGFESRDMQKFGGFDPVRSMEQKKFLQQTSADNKKYLKDKLDERGELSESDKRYLIRYFDKYHAGASNLSNGEDSDLVAAFMRIAHDPSKDLRARQAALEDYFDSRK